MKDATQSKPIVTTLSNGLRVVCDPMPGIESVAVGVWVAAGAMDERETENGVAHLLEHMAFKGTTSRTARQIVEEMENIGGHVNAATSYPHTGYYARLLKGGIACAVDILADILTNPLFEEDALATEKDVVIQEIGEAQDTPDDVLFEQIQLLTYAGQPLGRPILGDSASVRRQTPQSLRAFMARTYRADQTVICASGGVDQAALLQLVERKFADFGTPPAGGSATRALTRHTSGAFHDERDLEQTHIAFAAPGGALRDEDYFAWRLFGEMLGGGMSSRLFQTVRETLGLAYSVYAYTDAYDDIGTTGVYLGVDADDAGKALETSYREIRTMASGVSHEELDRARALVLSSYVMSLESPAVRAERAAAQLFSFGRLAPSDEIKQRLQAVGVDDIAACAQRFLASDNHSLAVVGPADFDTLNAIIADKGA